MAEFVFELPAEGGGRHLGILWLSGVLAATALATIPGGVPGVVFGLGLGGIWVWRSARRVRSVRIGVDRGDVLVSPGLSRAPALRLPLVELQEVELETTSIRKARTEMRLGLVVPDPTPSLVVDESRIVLDFGEAGGRFPLLDEFSSSSDVVLRAGKLRVFLRSHGWLPQSERGESEP